MFISQIKVKAAKPAVSAIILFCLTCFSFGPAIASGNLEEARAQFEKDKTFCREDPSVTNRQACLREAGAVFEKKRSGMQNRKPSSSNSNFSENAIRRCDVHTGVARDLCLERIKNGPVEGSVKKGGVLYEATRTETLPANP